MLEAFDIVDAIFEKIVDIDDATCGETAAYIKQIAAMKQAYSSMSWPQLSRQIFNDRIWLMRLLTMVGLRF